MPYASPIAQSRANASIRARHRNKVLLYYSQGSMRCRLCGYTGTALQLDHLLGNGNLERRKEGKSTASSYRYLIKKRFPDGYQVLCANCNWEKELARRQTAKAI